MLCVFVPPPNQHDPDGGVTINMLWHGEQSRMNVWKKASTGKKLNKKNWPQQLCLPCGSPPHQDKQEH
jgi:hypothetical protein